MKISISNLAFRDIKISKALRTLAANGVDGIEVAPSLLFKDYTQPDEIEFEEFIRILNDNQIAVSALQSLFFGRPELQVLDKFQHVEISDHLRKIIRLASKMGTSNLVFGSPKNRIKGALTTRESNKILKSLFETVEDELDFHQITLLIEPNAKYYGADFLSTYKECIDFVDYVDSPWVRNQIDTGCQNLENESSIESLSFRVPNHIHVSAKDLRSAKDDSRNREFLEAVKQSQYSNWITIEMLGEGESGLELALENYRWVKELTSVYE